MPYIAPPTGIGKRRLPPGATGKSPSIQWVGSGACRCRQIQRWTSNRIWEVGVFRPGSTRPFVASRWPSSRAVTTLSHQSWITSSLTRISRDDCGRAPGQNSDIFSRPCSITWRPKSNELSWTRRTSSPRIKSSVISVTNTLIFKTFRQRVSSITASIKIGMVPRKPSLECKRDSALFWTVLRRCQVWR
jgi:hypothetical protein